MQSFESANVARKSCDLIAADVLQKAKKYNSCKQVIHDSTAQRQKFITKLI